MRVLIGVTCVFLLIPAANAASLLVPPVDGVIQRHFEAPGTQWGPGHRGIDYAAPAGTAVRAVADGTVTFAGDVAGTLAVTISHGEGLESTYSDLSQVLVAAGDTVEQGFWIARSGSSHQGGAEGVHLGIKLDGAYVDPEGYLGPLDLGAAIRLAPLVWEPPRSLPALFRTPFLSAGTIPECVSPPASGSGRPNDNVAVLVAGIGSKTLGGVSAALYESGGAMLGYADADTYRFSYRGSATPDLHQPYAPADTFGDLRVAAQRLRTLLTAIAQRYPGRAVDLIAHSQGGIVARTYLELAAEAFDPQVPQVQHLVTFSTPHDGAPLAGARDQLDATLGGRAVLDAGSWLADHGVALPDPRATSVGQLAPGSPLLERLDRESATFGTRVLSLGIANDVVVPADHAVWDGYDATVVGPSGLNGHDRVVTAADAIATARNFLRDEPAACRTGWDLWGPRAGRVVSFAEHAVPWLYRIAENALVP
ncbi:MAG: hypothetical protein QOG04_116 [Actinomycetota bacterium]|jgi:hypothetical protein|nr:hypothetical protein [Actinomycetota bacterium]